MSLSAFYLSVTLVIFSLPNTHTVAARFCVIWPLPARCGPYCSHAASRQGSSALAPPVQPGRPRPSAPGQYGRAALHAGTRPKARSPAVRSQMSAQSRRRNTTDHSKTEINPVAWTRLDTIQTHSKTRDISTVMHVRFTAFSHWMKNLVDTSPTATYSLHLQLVTMWSSASCPMTWQLSSLDV